MKRGRPVSAFGKIVGEAQYLHKSALHQLDSDALDKVSKAQALCNETFAWNVVKIDLKDNSRISLLEYSDFATDAFPILLSSCGIDLKSEEVKCRHYSQSNPPVLHRKELLVESGFSGYSSFKSLTQELEELGAFENIVELGTKQRWELALRELGIEIHGHQIVPLNDVEQNNQDTQVFRYRTALKRRKLSSCMGALIDSSLVTRKSQIFDYGCGRGDDVAILQFSEFENVSGWDPHYAKDNPIPASSEFVNLSFVLNVIEDEEERYRVLRSAFQISSKALVFSVMLHHQNTLQFARPYKDGFLSSINTFQKYYSATEIEQVVQTILEERPIKMAAGVYIVFKDKELEQEYLFKKQLGLLSEIKTPPKEEAVEKYSVELVDEFVSEILAFGRVPKIDEINHNLREIIEETKVSYNRLSRLALSQISISELSKVQEALSSEILIFLAINMFDGRVKYGSLPEKMQNDVKAHFGSLRIANENAEKLLFSLSNVEELFEAALTSEMLGVGSLSDGKFRFHNDQKEKLPTSLKLFFKIGERLHRPIDDGDIVQLHIESKKMSYLRVDDFAKSPLPRIHSREIINFLNLELAYVAHAEQKQVRVLYNKSALMNAKDRNFEMQKDFDLKIKEKCSELFEGQEPKFEDFAKALMREKIAPPLYF